MTLPAAGELHMDILVDELGQVKCSLPVCYHLNRCNSTKFFISTRSRIKDVILGKT